jgi:hypothetical protein
MKATQRIKVFAALTICTAALAACSTEKQAENSTVHKEAILQQCGFKAVPATTPQQQQQMATLPPDKLSVVQRNGNKYYVFPDPRRQVLYVGHDEQFLAYQKYQSNHTQNADAAEARRVNENLMNWDNESWAPWDDH